jgi:hypothetical protein
MSVPALYDVCQCNHEAMLHVTRTKKCFFKIPVGQRFYRGNLPPETFTELCGCKKFKFSQQNTSNPKPTGGSKDE